MPLVAKDHVYCLSNGSAAFNFKIAHYIGLKKAFLENLSKGENEMNSHFMHIRFEKLLISQKEIETATTQFTLPEQLEVSQQRFANLKEAFKLFSPPSLMTEGPRV